MKQARIFGLLLLLSIPGACARVPSVRTSYATEWLKLDLAIPQGTWSAISDPERSNIWILACSSQGDIGSNRKAAVVRVNTATMGRDVVTLPGSCDGPASQVSGVSQDAIDVDRSGAAWGIVGNVLFRITPSLAVKTWETETTTGPRLPGSIEVTSDSRVLVGLGTYGLRAFDAARDAWAPVKNGLRANRVTEFRSGKILIAGRSLNDPLSVVDPALGAAVSSQITSRQFAIRRTGELAFLDDSGRLTVSDVVTGAKRATAVQLKAPKSMREQPSISARYFAGLSIAQAPDDALWLLDNGEIEDGKAYAVRYDATLDHFERFALPDVGRYQIGGNSTYLAPGSQLLFSAEGDVWLTAGDSPFGQAGFSDVYVLERLAPN